MRTVDVIAHILKRERIDYLSAFPTSTLIEAAVAAGIRPIICRQERVGVGIADGYSRVNNGDPTGVFAMQFGPGAENAYAGVATAFSDAVPMLLLPLGHSRDRDGVFPQFSSVRNYASITKFIEQVTSADRVIDTMRRAFARLRMGRPGPVMVEVPVDVAEEELDPSILESYKTVPSTRTQADPRDVLRATEMLLRAKDPVIHAGQGVLYADASQELQEFAELLEIPVMTTMGGKSAFPESHALALGSASGVMNRPVYHFLKQADVLFCIGTSLTKHPMTTPMIPGRIFIQAINDAIDIGKNYHVDYPIIGDAKLVLRQFIDAARDLLNGKSREDRSPAAEIARIRSEWLAEWNDKLTSDAVPINPYRVIKEFMDHVDPSEAIVTHDSGSPRDQMMPFYRAAGPRSYLGWGKSHGLGTGLGLNMGAKLARPDKFVVNFMGDAAFGMTGLDFETAVRSNLPILTIVLNNSTMAVETRHMTLSHARYKARDLGGDYAAMGKAMGGWSERVEDPKEVGPAIVRARRATAEGKAALLEFITSEEIQYSHKGAFQPER